MSRIACPVTGAVFFCGLHDVASVCSRVGTHSVLTLARLMQDFHIDLVVVTELIRHLGFDLLLTLPLMCVRMIARSISVLPQTEAALR